MQQVLAFESDLLEYGDLFDGSPVVAAKVGELVVGARDEMARIERLGGALAAVESGYMKTALVQSHAERRRAIESGDAVVVGLNRFTTTEPNPLLSDLDSAVLTVAADVEERAVEALASWRAERDDAAVAVALEKLSKDAASGENLMPASLACARTGVTTGEWADALRGVFGEYRAPTGVSSQTASVGDSVSGEAVRAAVEKTAAELGGRLRFLVGKPGLDGHSNGAEQIAVRARDAGFEVVYQGIRLTPEQIAAAAVEEDVHVVGLSVLSGSHMELVPEVLSRIRAAGMSDVPLVVGGIIPESDAAALEALGVAAVFTPKDYTIDDIMLRIVAEIRRAHGLEVADL
jgi:(2R)-ethylmalonyl-CoA mutase